MFDINQENYDIMCCVLEDIQKQVDELNIIEIEGKIYRLEEFHSVNFILQKAGLLLTLSFLRMKV